MSDDILAATKFLSVLVAYSVIWGNWKEAAAFKMQSSSSMPRLFWFIVVSVDDMVAAGLLFGIIRIMSGGSWWNVLWAGAWIAITMLMLRGGNFSWDNLLTKLADDVRDGFLLLIALTFWQGWGFISIPGFTLDF